MTQNGYVGEIGHQPPGGASAPPLTTAEVPKYTQEQIDRVQVAAQNQLKQTKLLYGGLLLLALTPMLAVNGGRIIDYAFRRYYADVPALANGILFEGIAFTSLISGITMTCMAADAMEQPPGGISGQQRDQSEVRKYTQKQMERAQVAAQKQLEQTKLLYKGLLLMALTPMLAVNGARVIDYAFRSHNPDVAALVNGILMEVAAGGSLIAGTVMTGEGACSQT